MAYANCFNAVSNLQISHIHHLSVSWGIPYHRTTEVGSYIEVMKLGRRKRCNASGRLFGGIQIKRTVKQWQELEI